MPMILFRDRFEVSMDSVAFLTALLPVSEEVRLRCHLHSSTVRALSMCGSSETLTLTGQEATFSDGPSTLDVPLINATDVGTATSSKKVPPPPHPYGPDASFLVPPADVLNLNFSVQMPKVRSITKQRSWTSQCGAFDKEYPPRLKENFLLPKTKVYVIFLSLKANNDESRSSK